MRRPFLAILLLMGTIGGYASGIAHWNGCWHKMDEIRAMRERHIADVCLDAARRANPPPAAGAVGAPAWTPPPPPSMMSAPVPVTPEE